jgi:hypothetical protein
MIDYWLGGSHNFEIDRQLADQVSRNFPLTTQLVREARSLVKRGVHYYCARGIRLLIDFGSSLPTCDNTHLVAHALDPNIKVIYSDIDPITAAYGQDLLSGNPNAIYLQADATDPHVVLDSPLTHKLVGQERRVGFIFLTLAHLLTDDQLRASWRALYNWAAPGSYLMVSVPSEQWDLDPDLMAIRDFYRRANIFGNFRTQAQLMELISPWRLTDEGIVTNSDWGAPPSQAQAQRVMGYSMMLYK